MDRDVSGVNYSHGTVPSDYRCDGCGATGVKLWRDHPSFFNVGELLCVVCTAKDQGKDASTIDENGTIESWLISRDVDSRRIDQIGWYIPAVPVEGQNGYWNYSAVPDEGIRWWRNLPNFKTVFSKELIIGD